MEDIKSTVSSPSNTERLLDVEIPRARFSSIFNTKVKKYSKELQLKGYRKGNVPKRIIIERFNEPLTTETLESLVQSTLQDLCKKHEIQPVAPGKVEDLINEGDGPIILKAIMEVEQEVDITKYKNLGIALTIPEPVKDEEIEEQIVRLKSSMATDEPIEGPGQVGDIAIVEYQKISVDGEELELPAMKEFRVEIGKDQIAEFNEAFTGCSAGEEKEINFLAPKNFNIPELSEKQAACVITIKRVVHRKTPELDEDFTKKLGFDTPDLLKESIRKEMETSKLNIEKQKAATEVINKIIENHPFDIPKAKIEQYIEYRAKQTGQDVQNITEEAKKALDSEATTALKRHRILDQISKKENIKATQAEVDKRITELASQYRMEFDTLKTMLRKNGAIVDIREEIKQQKTIDFLTNS